jgi:catechol 2,3-dioxygenase-like lactoylglutathione lyase family enzyme
MYHHLAIAVRDIGRTHHFYTEVMGFTLAAAVKRQAPGGGWTKHLFYDMGDGSLIAFWDLRGLEGETLKREDWRSGISTGLGLPGWVNHIAFQCSGRVEFETRKQRWLDHGYHVSVVDHDFIHSCYTFDPDGNWVEWTYKKRDLDQNDRKTAEHIFSDDSPATEPDYAVEVFKSLSQKRRFPTVEPTTPSQRVGQ